MAVNDTAKALINFYNDKAGNVTISTSSASNVDLATMAFKKAGDTFTVKEHILKWLREHPAEDFTNYLVRFKECFTEFILAPTVIVKEEKDETTLATSLKFISSAVSETIKDTAVPLIKKEVIEDAQTAVTKFLVDNYGPIERKVVTIVDGVKRETKGFIHEKFDDVLKAVSNNIPVYLVGPAGSGKNVLCKQVADALGLKFYFTNAVTQEYKLTGFTDAMGNYQPTQFYKAFTQGGLFMLDEIDASIPEVLTILNAAIANKYFDFPAPIGYVEAHEDFRVVAAGNTSGNGADYQYVGRNQLDAASTNRFVYETIDYSPVIEDGIALDKALADFCREFRRAAKRVGVNIIVSYRAIEYLTKLLPVMSTEDALRMCLIKDLEKDDLHNITRELHDTPYKQALLNLYSRM